MPKPIELTPKHYKILQKIRDGKPVAPDELVETMELYKAGLTLMGRREGRAVIEGLTDEGLAELDRWRKTKAKPIKPADEPPPRRETSVYDVTLAGLGIANEAFRGTSSELLKLEEQGFTISNKVAAGQTTLSQTLELLSKLARHAELTGNKPLEEKALAAVRIFLGEQRFLSGSTDGSAKPAKTERTNTLKGLGPTPATSTGPGRRR